MSVDRRHAGESLSTRSLSEHPSAADAAAPHAGPTPQIGDLIGSHLRIHGVLGSGGMGTVYLADDERLQRPVAVKLLHADRIGDAAVRGTFVNEARAMARIQHPNVVTVHTSGSFQGCPYLVMEYVRGDNLGQWHRRRGSLSANKAIGIVDAICRGVQAIHDAGSAHRDLKPSNIMVGAGERVAVSDFGLCIPLTEARAATRNQLTGTPAYLAPELARGEALEADLVGRVDVYALGVIAYELLTGRRPFVADTIDALLRLHAFGEPTPPSQLCAGVPSGLDAVISGALAKQPTARTPSARHFATQLRAAFDAASGPRAPETIMLVDDEVSTLQTLRALLLTEWPTAEVITVADPVVALELAARHQPDIVVTDLHMPHGGGAALTSALRASPATAATPIIVATGVGGAADWRRLRRLGADRFVIKPVDVDALAAMIRSLLRGPPAR